MDTWDPHEPWDAPDYYVARNYPGYSGERLMPPYKLLASSIREIERSGASEHHLAPRRP